MAFRISRREFAAALPVAATGAVALSGCGKPAPVQPARVSITRAAYNQDLYGTVRSIFERHSLNVRGRRVLLKPNLVEFEPGTSINTHPLVVHAAMEALLSLGAAEVRIAEGPGHRRNTLDLAEAAGYFQTVPQFENRFQDLNLDEVTLKHLDRPFSRLDKLYLPNSALSADLLVSIAKLKTHHWAGATLSMKNLFGVVPSGIYGWPKNVLHWAGIPECIADLHAAFPRQFALVDGIVGMEGNGPIQGKPKSMGILVAGHDPVAVDATCCRIMRIDPRKVRYLQLASGRPERLAEAAALQVGEAISAVASPFDLPPDLPGIRLATV
jgi:uncharacterized protein (DUF362 family)